MSLLSEISIDFQQCAKIDESNPILSFIKNARLLFAEPGLQAIIVYRLNRRFSNKNSSYLSHIVLFPVLFLLTLFVRKAYEIHISNCADIGQGLYIGHFGGIYIGECKIGDNCTVGNQVRIHGTSSGTGEKVIPVIGNKVWIGTHSLIEGELTIGDEATVSAGSVVRDSISKRSLVTGSPARVVSLDYDNSGLIR